MERMCASSRRDWDSARWISGERIHFLRQIDSLIHATVDAVERVIQLYRSFEAADQADDQFYANLTPEERLDLLLELVERHRGALGETASRFERVCRITELS